MQKKKIILFLVSVLGVLITILFLYKPSFNPNTKYTIGQKIDSLNGVYVFYNGGVGNIEGRNMSEDGYNLGLKYQCVEFVKRYYYQHYNHKMPDSYGDAKDFCDSSVRDGELNERRNLLQFKNPSTCKPGVGDLVVMDGHSTNKYGHVAIVSNVGDNEVEIIQQNPGAFADSRVKLGLDSGNGKWTIDSERLLGWLRIKQY